MSNLNPLNEAQGDEHHAGGISLTALAPGDPMTRARDRPSTSFVCVVKRESIA